MTTWIALLRAVNVGGRKALASDLNSMMAQLGFENGRTLLASGNLVFRREGTTEAELTARLEAESEKRLGFRTDYLVRSAAEWHALVAANPYPGAARDDPAHLVAMPLKQAPGPDAVESLRAAIVGRERVEAVGRTAYLAYPDGIGESKLTIAIIEKKLATRGTARNWNTVLKLDALASS